MSFIEPENWKHHKAEVSPGVKLHYVDVPPSPSSSSSPTTDKNKKSKTIVLIHGFPQTWYAYRHVIPLFASIGFRVLAVDYRGAGNSDKPRNGYDKFTMARDVRTLFRQVLDKDEDGHKEKEKVVLCGADIGSMVASSLALLFPDDLEALITFEAPIPGTKAYERATTEPQYTWPLFWHFFFHGVPDLPELLIQGKEREYISHFYHRLSYDPSFLSEQDLEVYTKSFSQAGAMRCGLDTYRAFGQDTADFSSYLEKNGKIDIPTLTMAGDASAFDSFVQDQTEEYASDVTFVKIPHSCHWIMEENPKGWVDAIKTFLDEKGLLP